MSAVDVSTATVGEPGVQRQFLTTAATDVPRESSFRAWWHQSLPLAGRQIVVFVRDVPTLMQALLFPALSMIMFKVVLGLFVRFLWAQRQTPRPSF